MFEDTKGVARIPVSKKKNRQYNGRKEKYKGRYNDLHNIYRVPGLITLSPGISHKVVRKIHC